jgi:hypothetical protein
VIGHIGNANGRYAYHLHFDVARVDLALHPTDWPNTNLARLLATYFDPQKFIREHRGAQLQGGNGAQPDVRVITASPRLRVRKSPSMGAAIVGYVPEGATVTLLGGMEGWGLIGDPVGGWIDLQWTRQAAR